METGPESSLYDTPSLQAYVWEYQTRVPPEPDTDIDDLLCKAAHAAFLERTDVDRLCPDTSLELTQPDGYEDLLCEQGCLGLWEFAWLTYQSPEPVWVLRAAPPTS